VDSVDFDKESILDRLFFDPSHMASLSGRQLELLVDIPDKSKLRSKYGSTFIEEIQAAADRHLREKDEIQNAVRLLKLYHHANIQGQKKKDGAVPKEQ